MPSVAKSTETILQNHHEQLVLLKELTDVHTERIIMLETQLDLQHKCTGEIIKSVHEIIKAVQEQEKRLVTTEQWIEAQDTWAMEHNE